MYPLPVRTGPHVMQASFIVKDLKAACMKWVKTIGVGPFLTVEHIPLTEMSYRGTPGASLDFSIAIAQSGGIQIELVEQHCDSPSAYRDLVAKGGEGFHHFCIYPDDYDAAYRSYLDQGFVPAIDGMFGATRFSYIDTSPAIGCMIELLEKNPIQESFFTRVIEAARDWDGTTDPVRPAFPS